MQSLLIDCCCRSYVWRCHDRRVCRPARGRSTRNASPTNVRYTLIRGKLPGIHDNQTGCERNRCGRFVARQTNDDGTHGSQIINGRFDGNGTYIECVGHWMFWWVATQCAASCLDWRARVCDTQLNRSKWTFGHVQHFDDMSESCPTHISRLFRLPHDHANGQEEEETRKEHRKEDE